MIELCPKCKSKNTWKRGFRKNKYSKKQKYHCKKCNHWFIKNDGFERMRNNKKIIVKAIHLHNEGLSLFQVKDYLWQHEGVKVTRQAVGYWCNKYSVFLK
jgi:transposase-like protein